MIKQALDTGLQTIRGFDEVTGLPDYIQSGPGGTSTLQDLELRWNKVGSLTQRKDGNRLLTEDFYYDDLHRLDYSKLNNVQNLDLSYDAMGNILTKSDVGVGTWLYHGTKKHAVISAAGNFYLYDFNGNQSTRNGETVTWTSYNYPSHVPNGAGGYHDYFYAADRQRWKQLYFNGTSSETTIFVGGILEKHTANGVTEFRHTISAGEQPVALYTRPTSGSITTQYFLLDHLGSVAEVTNSLGTLDVAENFAAFGERRDANDWSGPPSAADQTLINSATPRGYTFHTNSESSSLIHMNGRLMDGLTGRFLSPDPYVFQPQLTQGFNRYSYVNNNPLSLTDTSGFAPICGEGFSCAASVVYSVFSFAKKLFGGKKRPPPKGCFTNVGGTGCYGKAAATKLFDIARDIYGLPRLGAPPIWGVGEDRFGTGTCSFGPYCMSWEDVDGASGQNDDWSWAQSIDIEAIIRGSMDRGAEQNGAEKPADPVVYNDDRIEQTYLIEGIVLWPWRATVGLVTAVASRISVTSGAATEIANATWMGARVPSIAANMTASSFQSNLVANGYTVIRQAIGPNGPVTILSNGQKTYRIYTATSTGKLSAEVVDASGNLLSKIRLTGP